jgi:hypothetical protein
VTLQTRLRHTFYWLNDLTDGETGLNWNSYVFIENRVPSARGCDSYRDDDVYRCSPRRLLRLPDDKHVFCLPHYRGAVIFSCALCTLRRRVQIHSIRPVGTLGRACTGNDNVRTKSTKRYNCSRWTKICDLTTAQGYWLCAFVRCCACVVSFHRSSVPRPRPANITRPRRRTATSVKRAGPFFFSLVSLPSKASTCFLRRSNVPSRTT